MNIEDLIKYTAVAESWHRLSKLYPIILSFESLEELAAWTKDNPQLNSNPNLLWQGKEAADLYAEQRARHEDYQMQTQGIVDSGDIPSALSALPAMAFAAFYKPKYLWDDSGYLKIVEKKKEAWLKEHKQKDLFLTQEGIDFVYGSLEGDKPSKLYKEAEEEFRSNPKYQKRAERYNKEKKKIYKKINDDPFINRFKLEIQQETAVRYALLKKDNRSIKEEDVLKQVEKRTWERFIEENPEKTAEYIKREGKEHDFLKATHNNVQAKLQAAEPPVISSAVEKVTPQAVPHVSTSPSRQTSAYPQKEISRLDKLLGRPGHAPQKPYTPGNILRGNQAAGASSLLNKVRAIGNLAKALPILANPVVLIALGVVLFILIVVFIIVLAKGEEQTAGSGETTEGRTIGGGEIAGCTFYRGGDPKPELKIGNPEMASFISDVSANIGIPSSLVAGIMRVETAEALASKDQSYLTSDYDPHCSGVIDQNKCKTDGIAFGVMQFTPGTFLGTFEQNKTLIQQLFGKASVSIDIKPQNSMDPSSVFRIYSVKDSITAAALKIKNDKYDINRDGPWDEPTITKIAEGYYGCDKYPNCSTGPYSYGKDLWNSYSNCQQGIMPGIQNAVKGIIGIIQDAFGIIQKLVPKPEINSKGQTVYFYKAKPDEGITGEGNNKYWCTYLVVDAYNQAGFTGLTRANHGSVVAMKNYFENTSANGGKYIFLPPSTPATNLAEGDVIFFEGEKGQHVSLVKSKDINDGNGTINTLESNNVVTEDKLIVNNNRVISAKTTQYIYSITGFGRAVIKP